MASRKYLDGSREGVKEIHVCRGYLVRRIVCVSWGQAVVWLSVATRTLRPDKRPTSYGNSNSVQVFSASTFAAQRAVDWPGEQPGPQRRLSELQSVKTNARCPHSLLFLNHRPCRNTRIPSSVRLAVTLRTASAELTPGDGDVASTPPARAGRRGRSAAFKNVNF